MPRIRIVAMLALAILVASPALATDGYFQLGYGTPYLGQGGAGVALSLNTMAPATNPAANAWTAGYDVSVAFFNPNREFTVTGNPSGYPGTFGLQPGTVKSDTTLFVMPALGANWKLNDAMTLGVAIYGNGGMNTNYDAPVFYAGRTGVNLTQMFVAPTFTFKVAKDHAFGVSPIFAIQRFQAEGVLSFAPYSSNPAALSNNGFETTLGYGARFGYLGKLTPWLSIGGAYQTEIEMDHFDNYAGLFAEHGDFDIPENWTAGLAVKPAERFTIAFDVQWFTYSKIESIGNPLLPNLMQAPLGGDGGAGFGWKDVTVYKAGLAWVAAEGLTLRGGYAYATQPIPESQVLFNILAPGVIQHHATLGISKCLGKTSILHFSVVRAFSNSVTGPNPLEAPGQQAIELKMNQWLFDLGLSFGF